MLLNFQLNDYLVCPQQDKITCKDKVYKLEPKIMQVLCLLVKCQGEVLSRSEIASRLWPDSVVGLEVVTRAIFELRKVLNDDSKNPKYIETIAKKGYVFIASIEQEQSKLSLFKAKNKQILLVVCGFIVIFGFLLLFLTIATSEQQKDIITKGNVNYKVTVLSDGQADIQSAALSNDWSRLIYIKKSLSLSNVQLIHKNIKSHQETVLFDQKQELRSIIISPYDADLVYFIRCNIDSCEIIKQNIADLTYQTIYQSAQQLKELSLSPDGKQLAVSIRSKGQMNLALLTLDSKDPKAIALNISGSSYFARFSQNGSELFFVNYQTKSQTTIQRYNINTGETTLVTDKFSRITSLYRESKESLLVAAKVKGIYAIWRINLLNNSITQVKNIPPSTQVYNLIKKEQGEDLFYIQKSPNIDIAAQGLVETVNLTDLNSHANDLNGMWSEKNQTLYFTSQRTGNYELWGYKSTNNVKLTDISADSIARPILNDDQTKIAFIALIDNQLKLVIHDIAKNQTKILQNINEESFLLSWAVDNQSIYLSISSDNIYDIWQLNLEDKLSKKILLGAGLIAKESLNGNAIIFADLNSQQLVRKNKKGDITVIKNFVGTSLVVRPHSLKVIGENIYYIQNSGSKKVVVSEVLNQVQANKLPQQLFTLDKSFYVTDLGFDEQAYVIYDHKLSKTSKMLLVETLQ